MDKELFLSELNDELEVFGCNKKNEIVRLLFEISKREGTTLQNIYFEATRKNTTFSDIKKYLIQRRYPSFDPRDIIKKISLPRMNMEEKNKVDVVEPLKIEPKNIFIEESVAPYPIILRLKKMFPRAKYHSIKSYKDYCQRKFSIQDYNDRRHNFFIIREKFDFYISCPCSQGSLSCGYHNMKLITGCAFECVYCYMQAYINSPGIVIPANMEDFFDAFKKYKKDIRMGDGQFTDSLVFDDITGYAPLLVDFFKKYPQTTFEFKTKSNKVENLLSLSASHNIVVSWSVNPQKMIDQCEFFTASLKDRLEAARKCYHAGYRIGFHFDPIIFYDNWEEDYQEIVSEIFRFIEEDRIAWISLGCLRITPFLKQVIENRFPENTLLNGELFKDYDDKLRYSRSTRVGIYLKMKEWIRTCSQSVPLYLCMEEKDVCQQTGIL